MKKINETSKKKLSLNKRTIMKLNEEMMVKLNAVVHTTPPPTDTCRACDSYDVCKTSIITC